MREHPTGKKRKDEDGKLYIYRPVVLPKPTVVRSRLFVKQRCPRKKLPTYISQIFNFYLVRGVVCIEFSIYAITSKCFFKFISVN